MTDTIFPILSIDRNKIHWEDHLLDPTPVELHKDEKTGRACFFKREDFFAPLGYNGINGSKLRQAIYLGRQYIAETVSPYIVGAMSTHSPQLPMQTAVAKHFGKSTVTLTGGTNPKTAIKHPMVDMAAWFGSKFVLVKVGYNAVLQKRAQELRNYIGGDTFYMEYGITLGLEHSDDEIYKFHYIGAEQVKNIPEHITDLIIPAGSCNSATSILLGLLLYPHLNIKRIHLIGTGPSKIEYLTERLERMSSVLGFDTTVFDGLPYKKSSYSSAQRKEFCQIHFYDLHGEKFCKYEDSMPCNFGGIELHPTYEGKMMTYIQKNFDGLLNENTLFWIVGSEPNKKAMQPYYTGIDNLQELPMFEGI